MSQSGEPTSGIKFGNYEVVANDDGTPLLLGGGAYGKTYKAVHSFLGTTVALKVIHDSFAFDPGVKKRFLGEARAIAQLKHPHIAQVIDCGEDDGTLYYAMEYCDGGDLEKLVSSRGALSDETVLLLAKQAAKALAYVHDQKFLHRDLKPSNLMLSMVTGRDEANLKVIDFGLVKALGQENAVGMTQTGQFLGTLLYASPEQLREEELDQRTDVFSLGLTLWFLLEGGLPLKGAPAQVVTQRLSGKGYDDLLPKESHEVVRKLLSQMMHPAREERLADMHAVLAGISDCLAQIHGTGQILLEGKGSKSGTMPQLASTGTTSPRVQLVTSNQRMTTQFELGEEDKELQTDLGVRCRGRWIQRNEPVHLTIVRKAFAADVTVVHKLDQLVSKASMSEGPFLIRPQALVQFVDQLVLAEEHVEGLSLLNVLRARRQLSLSDASPILRQIAEACDLAMKAGINTLELVAHRVLFQFPRNSVLGMTGGGVEKLIMRPVAQWPQYLLRVAPAYTEAQRTGSSHMTNVRAPSLHGGATMVANADDDADSPSRFARLTYRVLSGHPVPVAAMMSQAAYVPIAGLSEEGNRLLAGIISRETPINDCLSLLQQIWRVESMPEASLLLPMPAEQMTNLRQAAPSEPPFVPPVQAPANTQDVVIIDPFTTAKRPTSTPPPAPRPQQPIAPPIISRQPSNPPPKARATEPPPPQPRSTSTPQVRPLGNVPPAQQPPSRPATAAPPAAVPSSPPAEASRSRTQPPTQKQQPPQQARTQTPTRPPTQGPPISQPEPWTRPPTSTPVRRGTQPPPQQQPEVTAPPPQPTGRSPHLPPPPERKPLPTKLIAMVGGGIVVLVGIVFGVMQLMKPDPVVKAIADANGNVSFAIDNLKTLVNSQVIDLRRLDAEVRKMEEAPHSVAPEAIFGALHDFYRDSKAPHPEEDLALIDDYKDKGVESAWEAFIANAEASKDTAKLIEGHLHRASKADSTTSRNWLVKQDIAAFKAVTGEKLQTLIDQFKRSLASSSPSEKKESLPKLATLMDQSTGAHTPESDWAVYSLFRDQALSNEAEAKARLERAAQSGKEEYVAPWLAQLPAEESLKAHLKLAPARPESVKEIASRFVASSSATEQKDILKVLAPLRDKVPAELLPPINRKMAELEIAETKGITWTGKRDIYQKYNLNDDAERVLLEAAKAGDEDAKMFIEDKKMRDHPEEQWRVYPERVAKGSARPAQDALRWLLTQKDADLIAHADVVKALLEKRLPSPGSTVEGDEATIVRKVGALRAVEWNTQPDGLYRLFQYYDGYKLKTEADSALQKAAEKGIEPALLELARRSPDGAPKIAAYLNCAEKKHSKEAIDWLLNNLKAGGVPPELQPRLIVVLETELTEAKADKTRSAAVIAPLVSLTNANKSLSDAERTAKLKGYYATAGMDEQLTKMEVEELQAKFAAATKSFGVSDQRKMALTELHRLANSKIGPEVVKWLQANLEARAGTANFQVLDPLDEAMSLAVSPADWKPAAIIALAKPVRYFKLPVTLPPVVASKEGSVRPSSRAEGKITNPYTDKPMTVARASWFPGAEVVDPDTDRKFILPQGIELLVASFAEGKGEPSLKNPFDPNRSISLAAWATDKDWGRWKAKSLEMAVEGMPDHKFLLPDIDEVPALKREVTLDKCDLQKFALVSPFTGASIPFTVEQWRSGASVADTSMKDLGLSATIALPEDRPVLEAKLTGKPFEVSDPYENQNVLVHWSQWKPGQLVSQLMNDEAKPSKTKGKSSDKQVRFKLPADLGTSADPQLEASTPDHIGHTVVSPYGGHKVTVEQKDWKPGTAIKDSEYAHLSIKLPADLKGEWFEMKEGSLVEGSYSKVRSPYGEKAIVSVSRENWESGKAKEDEGEELPFLMPKMKDPALEAKVVSDFKFQAKNPYTGETETWSESSWHDGASKTWAGNLTYHLPNPVPKFEIKTATYQGDRVVRSPYEGGGNKTLTWNQLAAGGTVTDDSGRPMRVPSISDPHLPAKATNDNGKVTVTNPYTGEPKSLPSNTDKGDSVPSGIGSFTIKITDMEKITLKKRYVFLGVYAITLNPADRCYYGDKGQLRPGGNPRDFIVRLKSDASGRGFPGNYQFEYDETNQRIVARPK